MYQSLPSRHIVHIVRMNEIFLLFQTRGQMVSRVKLLALDNKTDQSGSSSECVVWQRLILSVNCNLFTSPRQSGGGWMRRGWYRRTHVNLCGRSSIIVHIRTSQKKIRKIGVRRRRRTRIPAREGTLQRNADSYTSASHTILTHQRINVNKKRVGVPPVAHGEFWHASGSPLNLTTHEDNCAY